jgi:hypothetical protein
MFLEGSVWIFPPWDSEVGDPKIACVESSPSARSGEKGLRISSRGQWERIKQRTTLAKYRLGSVYSILSSHFHQEPNYIEVSQWKLLQSRESELTI